MTPDIEGLFYAKSIHQAEIIDSYISLHIKKRPWYMPKTLYNYILKNLLEMQHFVKLNRKDNRQVNIGKDYESLHVCHDSAFN